MSDTAEHNESRGRQNRADEVAGRRRRRRTGSLNRMAQFKLDCIEPQDLDLEKYVYRWVNDEPGKLKHATVQDDYDYVSTSEIGKGFDPESADSESTERIRMLSGTDKHGNAQYTYLLRKPREFWEEDNEEAVRAREDMMAGRVFRGETTEDNENRPGGGDKFYVPEGNSIGSSAQRRRGPISRK